MSPREDRRGHRKALRGKLSAEEVAELGLELKAGDDHYRAFVGPPATYDILGGLQFELLFDLGLREYHRVLDIGCGSVRLGRMLIPFLLPGRYYGLEPNRDLVIEGLKHHFGGSENGEVVRARRPVFAHNAEFDFRFVGEPVDFIMAQSIASHTGIAETKQLFRSIASVCHAGTVAVVTYCRCRDVAEQNTRDGWFYPKRVHYADEFLAGLAESVGLLAYRSRWPLANDRGGGTLVSWQTPLILTKSAWQPPAAQLRAGSSSPVRGSRPGRERCPADGDEPVLLNGRPVVDDVAGK